MGMAASTRVTARRARIRRILLRRSGSRQIWKNLRHILDFSPGFFHRCFGGGGKFYFLKSIGFIQLRRAHDLHGDGAEMRGTETAPLRQLPDERHAAPLKPRADIGAASGLLSLDAAAGIRAVPGAKTAANALAGATFVFRFEIGEIEH